MSSPSLHRTVLAVALVGVLAACNDTPKPAESPAATTSAAAGTHMITNAGHQLAFYVTPGHEPAIVLDSGGGEDATQWKDLVPKLSAATGSEIITYDRAGMGASDEVKGAWDVQGAVSDLAAGLRELGVTGNVILVSHSQAGEVATTFVRANPKLVTGAVLVDANLPQFFTDEETARLVAANTPRIEELKSQPSTKESRQLIATAENFGPAHHAYHQLTWPDGVPATVIVSEKTPFDGSPVDAQRWRDAAAAFVKAGPDRTLVTAAGSSHEVPKDRPDLVLAEVAKMAQ